MPEYVCGVAAAEGLVGGASQIAMVEDHRAVAGNQKKRAFQNTWVRITIKCFQLSVPEYKLNKLFMCFYIFRSFSVEILLQCALKIVLLWRTYPLVSAGRLILHYIFLKYMKYSNTVTVNIFYGI